MKKILLTIVLGIFLISLASATDYLPHKQGTALQFSFTDDTASACNASTIDQPGGVVTTISQTLDVTGDTFNGTITGGNFSNLGVHCINIECDEGYGSICREVTYGGDEITQQQVYIYLGGLIFLILLILGISIIIRKLPSKNSVDDQGMIVQINQLKHLRNVLWVVIWTLVLGMVFIISNLAIAYLNNSMLGEFFFTLYQIMFWVTIIAVPVYFIWIFYKIWQDKEMKRLMGRGVGFRGVP